MKQKLVRIGVPARTKLIKGANFLADAVKSTFGPYGQNFLLEKGNKITNDGVSVAREMEVVDEIENRGLNALREAAIKTDEEVGDGTTTATILAQAILQSALKQLPNERSVIGKMTPFEVIQKIENEKTEITEKLIAMATPITTEAQLIDSATVSVVDKDLGKLIGETQYKLGKEGVMIAEETNDSKSSIEMVNGIRLDNGFGASLVINNHEDQSLVLSQVTTLLTNHTIQGLKPILPVLEQLAKAGVRNLTIIARAFSGQAIKDCMENTNKGFTISPINAPYTDQNEVMKDLAAVLGGRYIFDEETDLTAIQVSDFGFAERIVAKRYTAVVTGVKNDKTAASVDKRIKDLEARLPKEPSLFEKKNIQTRIAQLTSGFAIVRVGASSLQERKYKYDKAVDAVNAVRAAYQEGVVPGAGKAFAIIAKDLPDTYILKSALMALSQQITSTAPKDFKVPEWVKDPVKVLRVALDKACSVAAVLATAGGVTAMQRDKPMWVQQANQPQEEEGMEVEL